MGIYLNPSSIGFKRSLNSEIYVDKTGLIEKTNVLLDTEQKFICVSRPRRFGKSMAVNMLSAYYACGEDSSALFDGLTISHTVSYRQHLNQYNVIKVNMQDFLSMTHSMDEMLTMLQKYLSFDLLEQFEHIRFRDENNLIQIMKDIYAKTNRSFIILVDEWDCLFREYQHDTAAQKQYLDFLRSWLKDSYYDSPIAEKNDMLQKIYGQVVLPEENYDIYFKTSKNTYKYCGADNLMNINGKEIQAYSDSTKYSLDTPYVGMDAANITETRLGSYTSMEECRDYSALRPEHRSVTYYWRDTSGDLLFEAYALAGEVISTTDFRVKPIISHGPNDKYN